MWGCARKSRSWAWRGAVAGLPPPTAWHAARRAPSRAGRPAPPAPRHLSCYPPACAAPCPAHPGSPSAPTPVYAADQAVVWQGGAPRCHTVHPRCPLQPLHGRHLGQPRPRLPNHHPRVSLVCSLLLPPLPPCRRRRPCSSSSSQRWGAKAGVRGAGCSSKRVQCLAMPCTHICYQSPPPWPRLRAACLTSLPLAALLSP